VALGGGAAFGYWNLTQSNPAHAVANSLGQGATPSAVVSPPNSNSVTITFAQVTTVSGGVEIPASDYIVKRYPAGGGSPVIVTTSCSGTGTITCIATSVPDGTWQFTDTPTYATNWVGIESAKSGVVTVNTAPSVAITYPVNGTTYGTNWTGKITGTASSNSGAGTSITSVSIAIENTKTDRWWNGTSFGATTQSFVPASATTSWTLALAASALFSGDTYSVIAEAVDTLGNIGTSSTVSFTYDTAAPTVTITYPVNDTTYGSDWTGTITGTASSNSGAGTTITSTAVAIEDTTTGKWWNSTAFAGTTETLAKASGTTSWSLPFPASDLTTGNTYSVIAEATDSLANIATSTTVSFTYKTTLPTVTITYPVNNTTYGSDWTGKITGTASSNAGAGTSITSVEVAIENTKTGKWWNGSSFASTVETLDEASGTTSWSLALPTSNLTSGVTYDVIAEAADNLANIATSPPVAFTYCARTTTPPTATITYPVNKTSYGSNWTGSITGTASSNAGPGTTIKSLEVAIENTKTGSWWNGSSFSATSQTFVPASGTATWSLGLAASNLVSGDTYSVIAEATDSLGNTGESSAASFTYSTPDTTPPTVTITYPLNGATYGTNWTGTITGTASSNAGSGTTISTVVAAIENTKTDKWWNGTSFSTTGQSFVPASGTATWSLGLATSNLVSGDSYSVIAEATDSLGNTGTSSMVSFTYCTTHNTTPPSVSITYPVNNATYSTNWTGAVTGTASSNSGSGTAITGAAVAIENTTTGKWWDGSAFELGTKSFVAANSTTSWTLSLAASVLVSGDAYSVIAEATDSLGNQGESSTVSFTYSTAPPSVSISYPVKAASYYASSWTGAITGTAASNSGASTTVSAVLVSLQQASGAASCWTGSGNAFTAPCPNYLPVTTGTTTWSLNLAASDLSNGDTYSVIAEATDSLGNLGTSTAVSFTYSLHNTTPPSVTVTYPVNNATYGTNWTGSITGTASSNSGAGTTITSVSVAIENTTTNKWWSGGSFGASTQSFVPASGTTSWSLGLVASNLASGDTYSVIAEATDSLGNVATSTVVSFTYATALPSVTISYPVNNTISGTNWGTAITGSASTKATGATITKVKVSIQQVGGSCWTGSGNTYSASCPNYVAVTTGTSSWSLTVPKSDLTSGDAYKVTAQTTDSFGNVATSSTVTFTYDTALPSVTITYPVNKTSYGTNWAGKITGTTSSNSGAGTSITAVSVAIKNTKTDKWWNGSSFSATSQSFVPASGTATWSLGLAASILVSGDTYTVIAEATDSLSNLGTSSAVSFTYCTAAPTIHITCPTKKTTYGINWTGKITGTASSNSGSGTKITSLVVAIENTKIDRWWNGTTFGTTKETFVTANGTTSWSRALAAKYLASRSTYNVIAEATDSLGNTGATTTVSFTYSH
jgi:hypothetical protein